MPLRVAIVVVLMGAITAYALPQRTELIPPRQDFAAFPATLGAWHGKDERLEQIYLDALKLDDYILADFENQVGPPVNFYVAYYASQRKGQSAHSPRTCIPGGGWKIVSIDPYLVSGVAMNGQALMVNRTVIQMGDYRQLVYYWFQQRGRNLTNEYLVKWFLFWDALTRNRTDGALVRLTTMVRTDETLADGDRRLMEFTKIVAPRLNDYIPE